MYYMRFTNMFYKMASFWFYRVIDVQTLCRNYYFQIFKNKIMYVYKYDLEDVNSKPQTLYSYWTNFIIPLQTSLSVMFFYHSKDDKTTLYEIVHNAENMQINTIIKANDLVNYSIRCFSDNFRKDVENTISKSKPENIMCVSMYEYIVTDTFKFIQHSFAMSKLTVRDFVAYMKIKYRKAYPNTNPTTDSLTILMDDFTEQIFKANEHIQY